LEGGKGRRKVPEQGHPAFPTKQAIEQWKSWKRSGNPTTSEGTRREQRERSYLPSLFSPPSN